ncbi:MAG: sigma-70 family RNA polymerase sigma factor, partial [Anaerolineae bacterium]|nr:sigma-70 family RNA polymerase sigma factor [Anaerolineae bacterium]
HLRRAQRTLNLDDRDLVVEETPDDALAREDVVQRVRQAIGTLTDHHRKVITLVDMEGMSYAEVAEALEIRVGTVMSRLARARAQLRERLRDELSGNTATAGTARLRRVR